jgi:hypothetical protein
MRSAATLFVGPLPFSSFESLSLLKPTLVAVVEQHENPSVLSMILVLTRNGRGGVSGVSERKSGILQGDSKSIIFSYM